MIQSEIEEILFDLSYQQMDDDKLEEFFREMTKISMYKKISIQYIDLEYFLADPNEITSEIISSNSQIYIDRLLKMSIGFTDQEIYNVFQVLDNEYRFSVNYLYDDIFKKYVLRDVMSGCVAYFFEKLPVLQVSFTDDLAEVVTKSLEVGDLNFDIVDQISNNGINEAWYHYFITPTDIGRNLVFHYPIGIRYHKTSKKYIDEIYKKKINEVGIWSTMWPEGFYQEFLDAMPGALEEYYKNKVRLPLDSSISVEDYDYYQTFLDSSQVTQDIFTKEQIMMLGEKLNPGDIILSNKFSISEMKGMTFFSVTLYSHELLQRCIYEKEIIENKEIFNPQFVIDHQIFLSAKGFDILKEEHKIDSINLGNNYAPQDIVWNASNIKGFDVDYLEYLIRELGLTPTIAVEIISQNVFGNAKFRKAGQIIGSLYR